jgi:hypothetical protein
MTETEWLATTDPNPMLEFLKGKTSDRKLSLFACGCCRLNWSLLNDERTRRAVDLAERYCDGLASDDEFEQVRDQAHLAFLPAPEDRDEESALWAAAFTADKAISLLAAQVAYFRGRGVVATTIGASNKMLERLVRDIFSNPFRPITFNRTWLTSTVLSLANGIYEEKAFDRMPILADALQDAGCDSADLLEHCRGESVHVRGCWVLDLILDKQ